MKTPSNPYLVGALGLSLAVGAILDYVKLRKKEKAGHEPSDGLQNSDCGRGGLGGKQHSDGKSGDRRRVRRAEARAKGAQKVSLRLKKQLEEERRKNREMAGNSDTGRGESGNNSGGEHDPASGNDSGLNPEGEGDNE